VSAIYSDLSLAPIEAATALRAQTVRSRRREVLTATAAKLTRRELEDLRWRLKANATVKKLDSLPIWFPDLLVLSSVP